MLTGGFTRPFTSGNTFGINRAALPSWNPSLLFAAGERGAWYDPSDLSTLFQDSAGTTPVTATGQPVGKMLDKSGRGNHATQATTTARPLLQQDSGGRYYLATDGVDDFLGAAYVQAAYPLTLAVGAYSGATSSVAGFLSVEGGTSQYKAIAHEAAFGVWRAEDRNAVDLVVTTNLADASPHVAIAQFTAANLALYGDSLAVSTAANTNGFLAGNIFVGKLRDTGNLINGRIYGAVVLARAPSGVELASLKRYLAARSGVTL